MSIQENSMVQRIDVTLPMEVREGRIKVIGVGGGGIAIATWVYEQNIPGISVIVCDTDRYTLEQTPVPTKLLLGEGVVGGRGSLDKVETGRECAEASEQEIRDLLIDSPEIVVVIACLGKGTGTGATPVIARIAREVGSVTVGILTMPFLYEGMARIMNALSPKQELDQGFDSMMVMNLENMLADIDVPDFTVLTQLKPIAELCIRQLSRMSSLSSPGNSIYTLAAALRGSGTFYIGSGEGEKVQTISDAIKNMLDENWAGIKPYNGFDIRSSKKVILRISGSEKADQELSKLYLNELSSFTGQFSGSCDIMVEFEEDQTSEDKVKITAMFSGFDLTVPSDKNPTPLWDDDPEPNYESNEDR